MTSSLEAPANRPRILIVDDIADNRNLLSLMLSQEGFDIFMAGGGSEALTMVAQCAPNLILLDVMMPEMDGCQVATAVKGNPLTRTIPVIMVTAHDDPMAKRACLAAGAEDFLTKPVDRLELCMRVRNLLRLNEAIADADRARIQAERANSAKTQFLRAVTHELRTPLNAISGYSELLETGVRGTVNPEQTMDLARIRRASSYLLQLVDDVLTSARLEGNRALHPVSIALQAVLDETLGLCVLRATEKGITLTITPAADILVTADADRLQQVLLNLVWNTIDFCPNGGAVVISFAGDGATAHVRISDGGAGVKARDLGGIFEPFSDMDENGGLTSRRGIGLGLSTSRELARAMGGDVTFLTVPGQGSIFTLSLPVASLTTQGPRRDMRVA